MSIWQLCQNIHAVPSIRAASETPGRRPKVSPQLNRWSRVRSVRSGRKLDRPSPRTQTLEPNPPSPPPPLSPPLDPDDTVTVDGGAETRATKTIYIVSDGTGWTAEHCVNASLGQFDYCLVDHGCPVNTHLFSGVIKKKYLLNFDNQFIKIQFLLLVDCMHCLCCQSIN